MQHTINQKTIGITADEIMQFHRIASRGHILALKEDRYVARNELATALRKFYEHTPMDLDALEAAPDTDFAAEVFGIEHCVKAAAEGKDTGFVPRFVKPPTKQ